MSRRVIINDASILIEFHKLGMLDKLASLPHELLVPDAIWYNELLSIPRETKGALGSKLQV